jgi:hypothetical protein
LTGDRLISAASLLHAALIGSGKGGMQQAESLGPRRSPQTHFTQLTQDLHALFAKAPFGKSASLHTVVSDMPAHRAAGCIAQQMAGA